MTLKKQFSNYKHECGTDEAGRGCLAGPVVAAAVILPKSFKSDLMNDSKKLSERSRLVLKEQIEQEALAWKVAFIDESIVDQINILKASIKAMHKAIEGLKTEPEFIIVDGNKFIPYNKVPHKTIIKGDSKYMTIAAASILAKTHRDEYMKCIHEQYPVYNWHKNKGYPTRAHRDAIIKYGVSEYHRRTFKLIPDQLRLEL